MLRLISFAILTLGFVQLSFINGFQWAYGLAWLGWLGCFGISGYLLSRYAPQANPFLEPVVAFLAGLGLLMIARLAPGFLIRQVIWLIISTTALLCLVLIPKNLRWLRHYKYLWLLGGLSLLIVTLIFGVNPSGYGARLWLGLGGIFFQPSEPLKIVMMIFLAAYLSDRRRQIQDEEAQIWHLPHPAYIGPMLVMWGFTMLLLFWQRDLGAALLFFLTFLGLFYVAIGQVRYIIIGLILFLVAGFIGYQTFDYVALRVQGWWNPWLDAEGRSFQIVQSLLAFASGGIFGQGLAQGLPTAIPVVHTDFVFAAIAEEYGLVGAMSVLFCFWVIVSQAFHIALNKQSSFQQLLAVGPGIMLGVQTLVIMAGSLKLIPLTGVTLPFVSYGGSSLLTSFIMIGLLLFLSKQKQGDRILTLPKQSSPDSE